MKYEEAISIASKKSYLHIKKSSGAVSRVMYRDMHGACHLSVRHIAAPVYRPVKDEVAAYPPARTSSPQTPVYLTLQLTGDAARGVTIAPGGLLPHLFTLTA